MALVKCFPGFLRKCLWMNVAALAPELKRRGTLTIDYYVVRSAMPTNLAQLREVYMCLVWMRGEACHNKRFCQGS